MAVKSSVLAGSENAKTLLWSKSDRWKWLTALWAGSVFLMACRMVLPLCAVNMGKDLGWNKEVEGVVLSAYFWGYCTTQILGGLLSDLYGGDVVVVYAGLIWSALTAFIPIVAFWSFPIVNSTPGIFMFRVMAGAMQGVHYPSVASLIAKKIHIENRALANSFIGTGISIGSLVLGSGGSLLLSSSGWPSVFFVVGVLSLIWAITLLWFLFEAVYIVTPIIPQPIKPVLEQKNHIYVCEGIKEEIITEGHFTRFISVPWITLAKHSGIWALIICSFCEGICTLQLYSWLPTYFEEVYPTGKGWVFNVVPFSLRMFANLASGCCADYLYRRGVSVTAIRKLFQTLAMSGTALFLFILTRKNSYYWSLFCLTMAIGCNGLRSAGVPVTSQDVTPKYAGLVFGAVNSSSALAGVLGAYMAGTILERTSSWSVVFHSMVYIELFGNAVFLIFGTAKKIL